MVSSSHEVMHRIFHKDPGIFSRTLDKLGIDIAEPVAVSVLSPDLTEIRPLERRLDSLFQVDAADGASYLLAVESQGRKDSGKEGSWAYYVGYLLAKYKMPLVLLVTCQDESTARWAKGPFHFGMPQWRTLALTPLVFGPHNTEFITDPAAAAADIPYAVFAAIAHAKHPQADTMLKALMTALDTTDSETALYFSEWTQLGLAGSPAAHIWRNLAVTLSPSFFRSELAEDIRDQGRAEGEARGEVKALLRVFAARGVDVVESVRDRIAACTDVETLERWITAAVTAERAEDLFSQG
jgi:hypothetical protein